MIDPSINSLIGKTGSGYALCIIAGKRARQLISGANRLSSCSSNNAITIAAYEISENKIICYQGRARVIKNKG